MKSEVNQQCGRASQRTRSSGSRELSQTDRLSCLQMLCSMFPTCSCGLRFTMTWALCTEPCLSLTWRLSPSPRKTAFCKGVGSCVCWSTLECQILHNKDDCALIGSPPLPMQ
eukprot:5776487-Amphidinium_carterae.1